MIDLLSISYDKNCVLLLLLQDIKKRKKKRSCILLRNCGNSPNKHNLLGSKP